VEVAVHKAALGLAAILAALGGVWLDADEQAPAVVTGADVERAEALYAEGSYALAHEIYDAARETDPSSFVEMRWADTLWRSEAATSTADSSRLDRARESLEALVRDVQRPEDRDRTWAEAEESLGDFWWTRRDSRDWAQAWPHYEGALRYWGGSRDIEVARGRYLDIVWTCARPPWVEPYYVYGGYGNQIPVAFLYDALEVSVSANDTAHAHYLIAMSLVQTGGDPISRVSEEFEAALEAGRSTEWHDDALFQYARWLASSGGRARAADGSWQRVPDFPAAVVVYRRLVTEYAKGETRYYDEAVRAMEEITAPSVVVAVPSFFLPGSEAEFQLMWRNVPSVRFDLYAVDLRSDVAFSADRGSHAWLDGIDLARRKPVRSWTRETEDRGDHVPHHDTVVLDRTLPRGAYVLEAEAEGRRSRDVMLVTGAAVVMKTTATEALVWVADAISGAPRGRAAITLWARSAYDDRTWRRLESTTDDDGLARVALPRSRTDREIFVAAAAGEDQAYGIGYGGTRYPSEGWRIYAFTDRPAYRPGDEARWKVIVRRYDGATYSTPAGQTVRYEIRDPRGAEVAGGKLELNAFGSAWDTVALGEQHPLGEYQVTFFDDANQALGGATLFRLEEYKLPEFSVAIETPRENGKPVALRPGDRVEARVTAEYYFGGPVADADVEVVVHQRPLWVWWSRPREFPWFYEDMDATRPWWGGAGPIVHRETLKTDSDGSATVSFESPQNDQQDFEYTIEARVTDASRREIQGSGTVRVSRQRYFVFPSAEHHLYRPGDEVRIDLATLDANEQPVAVEGLVTIARERWVEVWIDPRGREVGGSDLDKLRRSDSIFPPPSDPGWRVKSQGYEREEIERRVVRTGEDGHAEVTFTARQDGYYRVTWSGDEGEPFPVRGETAVWVAERDTVEVGYHHGGVGIILDRDTFESGRTVPIMLTTPVRDAYVLFTVEGEDLYDVRLIHVTGTVKLVELEIDERYTPNVFLDAAMIHAGELFLDSQQVVVPPVEHFLEVEVSADREEYRPRQEGRLTVTTRDRDGNPVAAEVALALIDESVLYIQKDYAGDPRQFFYGEKRGKLVRTASTFEQRQFTLPVRVDQREIVSQKAGDLPAATSLGESMAYEVADKADASLEREGFAQGLPMAKSEAALSPPPSPAPGEEPVVQVRSDFRATALWEPGVVTGDDGTATVSVTFPDSLTTWQATARVETRDNRFGTATTAARTSKPLIVRLQAPRFFVAGDTVTVSAVINNKTASEMAVRPALQASGVEVVPGSGDGEPIVVPAGGERRVDWTVEAREAGDARLEVIARGDGESDAMTRDYRVFPHGIEKLVARSGKLRGDEARIVLDLPRDRAPGSTEWVVQVTPSLAVTLLDSLPYLIDYPYGCTEQTMSRFLPAAITARTLEHLGLEPEEIAGKLFGGIEPESADQTHPRGARDLAELDEMVRQGLGRLYDFQHQDGGWGWWKDGESDPFMTAYVVWGLGIAREAGIGVEGHVLDRGVEFLRLEMVEYEEDPDLEAWMLHAVTSVRRGSRGASPHELEAKAFDHLWTERARLGAYGRALLALCAERLGDEERAQTLVRNLENGVKRDDATDTSALVPSRTHQDSALATAHWGADGVYWRWSEGPVETTAFVLRALLAIEPQHPLVEPATNWLIRNRRGAQWSNTRDTAISVLTLGDYLTISGELSSEIDYEVRVNGRSLVRRKVGPAEVLSAPSRLTVDPDWIRDGSNTVEVLRHGGDGALYFSGEVRFWSTEEPIAPEGHEIFVRRQYYRLVGHPTLLAGYVYEPEPLLDGGAVQSGERVRVVLTIEAKNDYEYLVFEDLKPAGLEALALRSGEPIYAQELRSDAFDIDPADRGVADFTGRTRWVYQELRDRKVVLFVDKLPQGRWEIRYDLRAETPGSYHALPVLGHAMYVPEIRCNGAEVRVDVQDR
jgi:uncharacterized protein YfaS (alpha-2-macroglobulin family)/tetratricopeptide (TPR) repeat protein